MSERVELARPFAVMYGTGDKQEMILFSTERGATDAARDYNGDDPEDAPHIVVRLTAERVEEPIPEAKSGWEWKVTIPRNGVRYLNVKKPGWGWDYLLTLGTIEWMEVVPPCDHEHVAALLRREGVE